MRNSTMSSNWYGLAEWRSEELFIKCFLVRITWLTQYHPPAHTPLVQQYLDRLTLDDQIPDETTGKLHGRPESVLITETWEREILVFEGAELDIVEPEPDHKVEGKTAPSELKIN